MTVEIAVAELHQQEASGGSAPPIPNRFLFVNIAAMRAKQLHRGLSRGSMQITQPCSNRARQSESRWRKYDVVLSSTLPRVPSWRDARQRLRAFSRRRCQMPLYEYVCRDCEKTFEMRRPMAEATAANVKCPSCGSTRIDRIYSSVYAKTSKKS
jgi:putative FmdB family regulatory protein